MAEFIPADLSQPNRQVRPANGRRFSLEEMQGYVGGIITYVTLPDNRVMVCNEGGKDAGLSRNHRAGELVVFVSLREVKAQIDEARRRGIMVFHDYDFSGDLDGPADYIAGDVLVCENEEVN